MSGKIRSLDYKQTSSYMGKFKEREVFQEKNKLVMN